MQAEGRIVRRRYRNRVTAGRELGTLLADECPSACDPDLVVLGLPRGGVPVAAAAAARLDAPVDILVVRKLGVPGHEELAMGAIASGGSVVLNDGFIQRLGVSDEALSAVVARESKELERRETSYRRGRPNLDVGGMAVIVVDDGIATGASMKVALEAVRQLEPRVLHAASPVASVEATRELSEYADGVFVVTTPEPFYAVGYWYDDFAQTTDDEVIEILG
jgi:predicted phosphoribosyltransferase